jgi:predicted membrane GTPase involved in stress response
VDVRPAIERELMMKSQRIKMSSPGAGSFHKNATTVPDFGPFQGRLAGVTVFIDTPDTGDYVSVFLNDRIIVDQLIVDLIANTSYEKRMSEKVQQGDIIEVAYFSAGTTTKTATWTPEITIS